VELLVLPRQGRSLLKPILDRDSDGVFTTVEEVVIFLFRFLCAIVGTKLIGSFPLFTRASSSADLCRVDTVNLSVAGKLAPNNEPPPPPLMFNAFGKVYEANNASSASLNNFHIVFRATPAAPFRHQLFLPPPKFRYKLAKVLQIAILPRYSNKTSSIPKVILVTTSVPFFNYSEKQDSIAHSRFHIGAYYFFPGCLLDENKSTKES